MRLAVAVMMFALSSGAYASQNEGETYLQRAFRHGERIEFSLSWLRMAGGDAVMTIAPSGNGDFRIHTLAKSNAFFSKIFPVRDEIESTVDQKSFSTKRFRKTLQERKRFKEEITEIDGRQGVARRKGKEIAVPSRVFDPLSMIFHIRTLRLEPGVRHSLTVLADGKVYTVEVEVVKRETITTDAGTFNTVLVEPKMGRGGIFKDEANRMLIWYTDDERHIPVRMRSLLARGSITASLRGYSVGAVARQVAMESK